MLNNSTKTSDKGVVMIKCPYRDMDTKRLEKNQVAVTTWFY